MYRATLVSGGGVETMVAIKVLHKQKAPKGQALQRLRDEGKALGLLRHPAIVKVMDLVELDGRAALVTEYIEGVDLGVCFRQGGLGPRALVGIVAQVAAGLDAAWNTKVPGGAKLRLVHRDVKPENIRIGRHGDVKLLDFGIAKAAGMQREARTEAGDVVGSYRYMAPERLARNHEDSPEGDVYSLAAVLYEGLASERLFAGRDLRGHVMIASDAMAHNAFITERLGKVERFGPVVHNLLSACLAYDPRLRPSASKMAAISDDLTDTLPGKNLRQWMRSWDWPDEDRGPGPLTGKVIMDQPSAPPEADKTVPDNITVMVFDEPTMDANAIPDIATKPSVKPLSPLPDKPKLFKPSEVDGDETTVKLSKREAAGKPPPGRSSSSRTWLLFALFTVVVLGGSAFTGLLGGLAIWRSGQSPVVVEPAAELTEDDLPEQRPLVVPDPEPEPEPEPEELPDAGTPSEGEAAVDDTDAPDTSGVGQLEVQGKVPVEVRREGETRGPGEVPTGAWQVWADFGSGMVKTTAPPIVMFGGTHALVQCNKLKQQCDVTVTEPSEEGAGEAAP